MLLRTLLRAWGGPGAPWEARLTLAFLWLAEALLLIRKTVADAIAGFNPLGLPSLVPSNNVGI